ncbi:unnamed protein product [Pylaiella littoralis]
MDAAIKARRSQALIDSIEELIALEGDVSRATECCNPTAAQQAPQPQVMVPVTEVGFMPGTVAGESVMVGLGQDYYAERTPREAQAILRRRMDDLSGQARVLAEGVLLVPRPPLPLPPPRKPRRRAQGEPGAKMKWAKGFLSTGPDRSSRGQPSPQGEKAPGKAQEEPFEDRSSPTPTETKYSYNDSDGEEHVVRVEDGEAAPPIMEIREWLDESGKQTSVDVTDLGKVLGTTSKAVKAGPPSTAAEAASPSLGPQWKKGFLDSGAKRLESKPSAATTPRVQEARQATAPVSAVMASGAAATSKTHAFRETVVEKTNTGLASSVLDGKPAVEPARISRFKARRHGL